ncbi:MAG: HAD family phosphatase [Patescibacteria group bacterium]
MKKITTIIFDWAGVFCNPGEPFFHPEITKQTGLSVDEMGEKSQDIQKPYYRGEMSKEQFWNKIIEFFKLKNLTPTKLGEAYTSSYKIWPEMLELAKKLKKNYKTAVLSNLTEEMMEHILNNHNLKKIFPRMFFSNEIGIMKPNTTAYELALKELGSKPEETIFIDDSKKNVEAARNLGMYAFLFESLDQCKSELQKLGVNV